MEILGNSAVASAFGIEFVKASCFGEITECQKELSEGL